MLDYEKYVEADLLERLTPDQAKLAQLMSDISEECYCAGWMIDTEYRLWRAVTGPTDDRHWGQDTITDEMVEHLRALSERIGGWIIFTDADGETFAPMAEWLKAFSEYSGRNV